jgi:hypothetical protein
MHTPIKPVLSNHSVINYLNTALGRNDCALLYISLIEKALKTLPEYQTKKSCILKGNINNERT